MNAQRKEPLDLIEAAVQLLRTSPPLVFALYCAGTVPFLLTFFSFCAEMSYDRRAVNNCAASATVVALTYCWMKGLQAFCCRELVHVYTGNPRRWWKPAAILAIWCRQIAVQPLGFFLIPVAWLLVFPVAYVSAFFQNLTILGGTQRNDLKKSWELARLSPKQSYAVYGLLSLLTLIVFLDLYVVILSIPYLLKLLLGIESVLTSSPTWAFSPLLLIAAAALAHFLIDLLAKAVEVIRCCDGESLATGGDLLRRLADLPPDRMPLRKQSVLALPLENQANRGRFAHSAFCCSLAIAALLGTMSNSAGSDTSSPAENRTLEPRLTPLTLDRQIERVLQNPEYSWREPSAPPPHQKRESILEQWIASVRRSLLSFGGWVDRLFKSLLKRFALSSPLFQPAIGAMPLSSALLNALGYALWVAFGGALVVFLIRILKSKAAKLPPSIASAPSPDLTDERIEANQLADSEWYALAREKMAAGELPQAQRALFLAILSYLASHRFIAIARWKSNIDYEKEIVRQTDRLSQLPALYRQGRLGFERCWYGSQSVSPADLENYSGIYERIKHAAQ
ncbi:MAG: hypothetical protein JOZ60_03975 [Verrucomicrobia bacterium]|nr:hypothetical protein [Verrucomicrobiota bacterium]